MITSFIMPVARFLITGAFLFLIPNLAGTGSKCWNHASWLRWIGC